MTKPVAAEAQTCIKCGHAEPQAGDFCTVRVKRQGITDDGHWTNCACKCKFPAPQVNDDKRKSE